MYHVHEIETTFREARHAIRSGSPALEAEPRTPPGPASSAVAAGLSASTCNHTFRATGITTYLKNGGKVEVAQQIAGHESARTTGLYDRRDDEVSLDEVEKIII